MLADKLNGHHLLAPCKGSLMQNPTRGYLPFALPGALLRNLGDLAYV